MRRSFVLTFAGGVVAATSLAILIPATDMNPAVAKTMKQCIDAGTQCGFSCHGGPASGIRKCEDNCYGKEARCIFSSSDAGDHTFDKNGDPIKDKDKGANTDGCKKRGGIKGQCVVSDPPRGQPKPPGANPDFGGPGGPVTTATPSSGPSTGTYTPPSGGALPPKPPFLTTGSGPKDWSIGGVKGYRP
jgi:hypothetical protein